MASAYTTLVDDPWGRPTPAAEPPSCPLCEWGPVPPGDAWTIGAECYCRQHAGLASVSVLEDVLSGDEVPPRVLRDACEILTVLIARVRKAPCLSG